jgi:PKD domain/Phosphate-induced protein 1 conserved region
MTIFALAVVVALGFSAAPAVAVVVQLGGHSYGVASLSAAGADRTGSSLPAASRFDELPGGGSALNYHGGPVMHSNNTHVVYWDPEGEFTGTTKSIVARFFGDVAHDSGLPSNVFAVDAQYQDGGGNSAYNATFAGALTDSDNYPASGCTPAFTEFDAGPPYAHCLTDEQLQSELLSFIAKERLPKGPEQLYFVLLPHKVVTCFEEEGEVCSNNEFCAYHSVISPGTAGEIIYADIPFSLLDAEEFEGVMIHAKACQADGNELIQAPNGDTAGTNASTRFADVAIKYISHEYSEAITDPLLNAWFDANDNEIGDKCNVVPLGPAEEGEPGFDRHTFTPTLGGSAVAGTLFNQAINTGHYYLQSEWDNAANACRMQSLSLGAGSFTAPSGTVGVPASFIASATDAYGALEPTWSFGDGASASGVSVQHTYAAAGEYSVTMTPRDRLTGSMGASVTHTVEIAPPPAPPSGGGGAGGAVATTTTQAPAITATTTTTTQLSPTAVTAVTPRSTFATATAVVNQKNGVVTLTTSVLDPGRLNFRATFPNGRFGAFASSVCRKPRIRLAGRCLPATIVYASGSKALVAGRVRVTLRPRASALKALRRALRQRRGVPVTLVLTFQSAHGGVAFSRSQSLIVRPRR